MKNHFLNSQRENVISSNYFFKGSNFHCSVSSSYLLNKQQASLILIVPSTSVVFVFCVSHVHTLLTLFCPEVWKACTQRRAGDSRHHGETQLSGFQFHCLPCSLSASQAETLLRNGLHSQGSKGLKCILFSSLFWWLECGVFHLGQQSIGLEEGIWNCNLFSAFWKLRSRFSSTSGPPPST